MSTLPVQKTLTEAVSRIDITTLSQIQGLPILDLSDAQIAQLSGIRPAELSDYLAQDLGPAIKDMVSADGTSFMVIGDIHRVGNDPDAPVVLAAWCHDLAIWKVLNEQGSEALRDNITRASVTDIPTEHIYSSHKDASAARRAMLSLVGGSPLDRLEKSAALYSQSALLSLVAGLSLARYCGKVRADIDAVDRQLEADFKQFRAEMASIAPPDELPPAA